MLPYLLVFCFVLFFPLFCLLKGDGCSYFRRKVFLSFQCSLAHFTVHKKCIHVIYNLKMQTGFYLFVQLGSEAYRSPASFLSNCSPVITLPSFHAEVVLASVLCFSHLDDFTHAASLPTTFSSIFGPLLDHSMAPPVKAIINQTIFLCPMHSTPAEMQQLSLII